MADSVVIPLEFDSRGAVTGAQRAQSEVRSVGTAASESQTRVSRFGQALRTLGRLAPIAALLSLRNVFRQIGSAVRSAGMQQIVDRRLEQALRGAGDASASAMPRFKELADELQRTTNFSNEQVQAGQAMLLSFRETAGPEGAERLTRSMADLAAGAARSTGQTMDLTQSAQLMGRAMTQGVGALSRAGISLSETQREAFNAAEGLEKVAMLAEIIEDNYGGMAEATADWRILTQNAVGEVSKAFGEGMLPAVTQTAAKVVEFVQRPGVIDFFRTLGTFVGNLGRMFVEVARAVARVGSVMLAVHRINRSLSGDQEGGLGFLERRLVTQVRTWNQLARWVLRTQEAFLLAAEALARFIRETNKFLGRSTEAVEGRLERYQSLLSVVRSRIDETITAHEDYTASLLQNSEAQQQLRDDLQSIQDALNEDITLTGESTRAKEDNRTAVERLADALAEQRKEYEEMNAAGLERLVQLELQRRETMRLVETLENAVRVQATLREMQEGDQPLITPGGRAVDVDEMTAAIHAYNDEITRTVALMGAMDEVGHTLEDTMWAIGNAFGGFAQLAEASMGRQAATFKALAIAEAIMATFLAATQMLNPRIGGPPPLNYIQASAVTAAGMANVARIISAGSGISGGSGGGGGRPGGASSAAAGISMGAINTGSGQQAASTNVNVNNQHSFVIEPGVKVVDGLALDVAIKDALRRNFRGTGA